MAQPDRNRGAECVFQYGTLKIVLKQGDLLSEVDVDARVIPTPNYGSEDVNSYQIYRTLCSSVNTNTRKRIELVSKKVEPDKQPQVFTEQTPWSILTSVPYFENEKTARKKLSATYANCLRVATDHKCNSVAFPTIGCGASGFNVKDTIEIFYTALVEHEQLNKKSLEEIRIIAYKDDVYYKFVDAFLNFAQDKKRKLTMLDMSSSEDSRSGAPSHEDKPKSQHQRASGAGQTDGYEDDFEVADGDKRQREDRDRRSNLNPHTPEFTPKDKNQPRPARLYRLSNNKAELSILQGDILKTKVDAIVNAANEMMTGGGGVDGVIHRAAGDELYRACKAHKQIFPDVRLPTGRSRILLSYQMSRTTNYIINTSGPRYDDAPPEKCREYLTSCYKTSLALANLYDLETIAYTAISCGIFGYPIDEGAEVALRTVNEGVDNLAKVTFVLWEDEIYDAWVRQAKRLGFTSLDGLYTPKASVPSRPDDDRHDAAERGDARTSPKVLDASTEDTRRSEKPGADRHSSDKNHDGAKENKENDSIAEHKKKRDKSENDHRNLDSPSQASTNEQQDKSAISKTPQQNANGGRGGGRTSEKRRS